MKGGIKLDGKGQWTANPFIGSAASSATRPHPLLNVEEEVASPTDVSEDSEEERTRKMQKLRMKMKMAANKCMKLGTALHDAESELDEAQRELEAHASDCRRSMNSKVTITPAKFARPSPPPPPPKGRPVVADDEVGEAEAWSNFILGLPAR